MKASRSDIKIAIKALEKKNDDLSLVQLSVIKRRMTETQVFQEYVVNTDEKNEERFFAARDAAQFLTGKLDLTSLIPADELYTQTDLEEEFEAPVDQDPIYDPDEMISIRRGDLESLIKRLERVEIRLGIRARKKSTLKLTIDDTDAKDLMRQSEAMQYIGCAKSTIRRWSEKGLLKAYVDGRNTWYSKHEIDKSKVVKDYKEEKKNE